MCAGACGRGCASDALGLLRGVVGGGLAAAGSCTSRCRRVAATAGKGSEITSVARTTAAAQWPVCVREGRTGWLLWAACPRASAWHARSCRPRPTRPCIAQGLAARSAAGRANACRETYLALRRAAAFSDASRLQAQMRVRERAIIGVPDHAPRVSAVRVYEKHKFSAKWRTAWCGSRGPRTAVALPRRPEAAWQRRRARGGPWPGRRSRPRGRAALV